MLESFINDHTLALWFQAQNVALKDRVEQESQTLTSRLQESTPNTELRRRLKDLAQTFKHNKVSTHLTCRAEATTQGSHLDIQTHQGLEAFYE